MIKHEGIRHLGRQSGMAVLAIAVILLSLTTIITLYANKAGIIEMRTSANKFRQEEAQAMAQAGIDEVIKYLFLHHAADDIAAVPTSGAWTTCTTSASIPCGDGSVNRYNGSWEYAVVTGRAAHMLAGGEIYLMTPTAASNDGYRKRFDIVSVGRSTDRSGMAYVRQGVYLYNPFAGESGPIPAPMMAAGNIGTGGNFHIVANPNGGGPGVPVSTWAKNDVSLSGSAATCHLGEFLTTDSTYATQSVTYTEGGVTKTDTITMCAACTCPTAYALSSSGTEGVDILDNDGNVGVNRDAGWISPDDMFFYVFGVQRTEYQTIKDQSTVLADCSSLGTSASGRYWITGNCNPPGDIGSFAKPVILIVEGTSKINSNNYIFGMIFAFSPTGTGTLSVDLNGTPTVYGAVLSNTDVNLSNGNYKMRFDSNVFANLSRSGGFDLVVKINGSWVDF